jgi:single-stranded DNA-binding protein
VNRPTNSTVITHEPGDLLLITGKLSVRTYSDKENVQRTAVEVIATDIRFLHANGY